MVSLIESMQNPTLFSHPIDKFEVIETHISQVLLTGSYVYKIKKPVNFGFLDFSTLQKRHHYCEEELRLNRRLAPQLYLGMVRITGSEAQPLLDGSGEVIEYAVKMRQFPQQAQLDRMLASGKLNDDIIDRLADKVGQFHQTISSADANSPFGDIDHLRQPMLENFTQIREVVKEPAVITSLDLLEKWTRQQLNKLDSVIRSRKQNGFVRECHGDMHLRNIAWWQDEIIIFDCIEFNPNLYWIDVISEIAFLIMDLEDRKQEGFAQRFLNRYLEITGDYEGILLLKFYKVYRALVRAKVEVLRAAQEQPGSEEYQQTMHGFRQYLELAEVYLKTEQPMLLINYGLSGSGKSVTTRKLVERLPAIQLRSDVERKRLHNVSPKERVSGEQQQWLYSREATDKTYARLIELARNLLDAGYSVVVDAANLKRRARQPFVDLANSMQIPYRILAYQADATILKERVKRRTESDEDVSDATMAVLKQQLDSVEPISEEERVYTIVVDTGAPLNIVQLVDRIRVAQSNSEAILV